METRAFLEEDGAQYTAYLKRNLAHKIGACIEGGNLERAEMLSRILGNLLDSPCKCGKIQHASE